MLEILPGLFDIPEVEPNPEKVKLFKDLILSKYNEKMKVIKQGEWKRRLTCKGCKSVLEANCDDVRYGDYSENYEDEFKGNFYIRCPICERHNQLKEKDVPSFIQEEALENRKD